MSEEITIPVYVPARKSIYNVKASELQEKLDNLRRHEDPLFRYYFVLSATEEKTVRKALFG